MPPHLLEGLQAGGTMPPNLLECLLEGGTTTPRNLRESLQEGWVESPQESARGLLREDVVVSLMDLFRSLPRKPLRRKMRRLEALRRSLPRIRWERG